jgi:hypothetical protein
MINRKVAIHNLKVRYNRKDPAVVFTLILSALAVLNAHVAN